LHSELRLRSNERPQTCTWTQHSPAESNTSTFASQPRTASSDFEQPANGAPLVSRLTYICQAWRDVLRGC